MAAPADPALLDLRGQGVGVRALLRDAVAHGDLLPLLARQHFQGQFRAARLGLAWSALQPLLRGAVLAVVFTRFVPIDVGVPYPAFIFAGTAIWAYLSASVTAGTTSITGSADLTGRVYFPRILLPAMPALSQLPSYLVSLLLVVPLTWAFGVPPTWTLLTLPLTVALGIALVSAMSGVLSLLHVWFRDVGQMVTAAIGIAFYATPIVYPAGNAGSLRWVLDLNPFTGAVSAVRWSLFGGAEDVGLAIWSTVGWTIVLAIASAFAFARHERDCADRL